MTCSFHPLSSPIAKMKKRYLLTSDLMFSLIINARLKQKEIGIRQATPSWESLLIYLLSLILLPPVSNIIFLLFIHAWNETVHNIQSGSLTLLVNVSCNLMVMSLILWKGFNVGVVLLMPECLAESSGTPVPDWCTGTLLNNTYLLVPGCLANL